MQKSREVQKDSSKLHYSKLYKQGSDRTRISGGASDSWMWRIYRCGAHEKAGRYLYIRLVSQSLTRADLGDFEMKASDKLEKIELEMLDYANKDELANQVIRRVNSDPEFVRFMALTCKAIMLKESEGETND